LEHNVAAGHAVRIAQARRTRRIKGGNIEVQRYKQGAIGKQVKRSGFDRPPVETLIRAFERIGKLDADSLFGVWMPELIFPFDGKLTALLKKNMAIARSQNGGGR